MKIKTVIGKKKCMCPRRRKVCANGKKPTFRKSPSCLDGSRPRCPKKWCSKRPAITEHSSTADDSVEPNFIFGSALSVTTEPFITEKHIDQFTKEIIILFNLDADQDTETLPQCKQVSKF
jgi:hypothetical protein